MIRRAIQWIRVVLPPYWAIVVAFVGYAWCQVLYRIAMYYSHFSFEDTISNFRTLRDAYVAIVLAALGAFRVFAFHPVFRPQYRQWLTLTPWRHPQPLPCGPVHLLPQDLLVVAFATLCAYDSGDSLIQFPTVFLTVYIVCLIATLWGSKPGIWSYLLLFAPALIFRLSWWHPVAGFATAAVSYGLTQIAVQQSLAEFPWDAQLEKWKRLRREIGGIQKSRANPEKPLDLAPHELSWQFRLLHAKRDATTSPWWHAPAFVVCGAWYFYVALSHPEAEPDNVVTVGTGAYCYFIMGAIVIRLWRYCWNYWPPISLLGRLLTFRWIIPSYDRVFVAPALTLMVGIFLLFVLRWTRVDPQIGLPICFTIAMLIICCVGPSLRRWRLTGNYRLWPGVVVHQGPVEEI